MNTETPTQSIRTIRNQKFDAINQKTDTHLEGLLWSKPITYWDYIQTDALLNLTNSTNHFARRNGFYYVSSSQ
jgi:tryptophan 2,3-dioxygenase